MFKENNRSAQRAGMEKMDKTVSIIVPIYKVEKYLCQCVDSILTQSYNDLEILLVDDGSPDHSGEICDEYARKDDRIKVIHKCNGGLSSARNAALDIATGEYILCVDSDDYIHSDMVRRMCVAMQRNQSDIVVCGHYVQKKDRLSIDDPYWDMAVNLDRYHALEALISDSVIRSYAWGKLYRSSLFQGVRYPDGRNYEDIATTYLLFDKAERITRIPDILYYYQMREDSISYNNSAVAWHKGCHASVLGQEERQEYLRRKGYTELAEAAMAKLVPYLYSDIRSSYEAGTLEDAENAQKYLMTHRTEIGENHLVSGKDKKLIGIYLKKCWQFEAVEAAKKRMAPILKLQEQMKGHLKKWSNVDGFSKALGVERRIVYFELPCFDNLGDHAIAYASEKMLRHICDEFENSQFYTVDGWDTPAAVRALKKVISPNDVIICHGGGNIGDLYPFAQELRRRVLKNFSQNKILILPQTVFYSDSIQGEKEKAVDRRIFQKCKNLTIFARDAVSLKMINKFFTVKSKQMKDMVLSLDETGYSQKNRSGIILCLRADVEGKLNIQQKENIRGICENTGENVLITDTCEKIEIDRRNRENYLHCKWKLWGKSKVVVTDRLHGMIFSLITETPCIVLGNNHHKVIETYRTIEDCNYITYVENEVALRNVLPGMLQLSREKIKKPDYSEQFNILFECIRK